MTVDEMLAAYGHDMERDGIVLDDEWFKERGLTPMTRVRFTTDSFDHFDNESLREVQEDC